MMDLRWSSFLEKAVWGLEEAAARLRLDEIRAEFETAPDWWRKPTRVGSVENVEVPEETAVSGALETLFERIQAEQIIHGRKSGAEDLRHFHFSTEKRRPLDPAMGKKTKPTDIAIILREDDIFDLRIEAKTLTDSSEIKSQYMSERGLLHFEDTDNPYTIESYGGMLAYIVARPKADWEHDVRRALSFALGDTRLTTIEIGEKLRTTSSHEILLGRPSDQRSLSIKVLHLAIEIDARPQLRSEENSSKSTR